MLIGNMQIPCRKTPEVQRQYHLSYLLFYVHLEKIKALKIFIGTLNQKLENIIKTRKTLIGALLVAKIISTLEKEMSNNLTEKCPCFFSLQGEKQLYLASQ